MTCRVSPRAQRLSIMDGPYGGNSCPVEVSAVRWVVVVVVAVTPLPPDPGLSRDTDTALSKVLRLWRCLFFFTHTNPNRVSQFVQNPEGGSETSGGKTQQAEGPAAPHRSYLIHRLCYFFMIATSVCSQRTALPVSHPLFNNSCPDPRE